MTTNPAKFKISKNVWYGHWLSGRRVVRIGPFCIDSNGVRRIHKK